MRYCPNCNKELEDKDSFCYSCGTKFPEKKEEDMTEVLFWTNCGNKLTDNYSEPKDMTAKDTIYLKNFDYALKPYTAVLYLYREGKNIKVDSGVNGGLDSNFE